MSAVSVNSDNFLLSSIKSIFYFEFFNRIMFAIGVAKLGFNVV
jgi:hypothetical protein